MTIPSVISIKEFEQIDSRSIFCNLSLQLNLYIKKIKTFKIWYVMMKFLQLMKYKKRKINKTNSLDKEGGQISIFKLDFSF